MTGITAMTIPGKMQERNAEPSAAAAQERSIAIASGHRIDSRDLFVATREVIIAHGEETYRLRLTSQNRLILTK